jgi:hypothetical protein
MPLQPARRELNYADFTYRVLAANQHTIGTAFLVAPRVLMTCAHVVSTIINGDMKGEVGAGTKISVQSALVGSPTVEATVMFHNRLEGEGLSQDLALLQLPEIGYIWRRAPYWCLQGIAAEREVVTWGFPKGYENVGAFAKGTVRTRVGDNSWQVDRVPGQGAPVQEGMSGSGVFDTLGRLMGMVCKAAPERDVFFVIPFDSFREAARSLRLTFSVAPNDEKEALQALLELNFNAQVNHYVTVAADHPTPRGILIHGKPRHGHGVIAHRIVNSRFQGGDGEEPRFIPLTFGRFDPPSVDIFYSELAEQIGIDPRIRRETILATLADMLRSDSIVLLIRTGAFTRGAVHAIPDLIDGFWQPLTRTVGSRPAKGSVLLLLLDEEGSRSSWAGLPMVSQIQVSKEHLVELPELNRICKDDLRSWLVQRVPRLTSALPVDVWVEAMWHNSQDGLPEALFHRFCLIFNQEWDMLRKWLLCA